MVHDDLDGLYSKLTGVAAPVCSTRDEAGKGKAVIPEITSPAARRIQSGSRVALYLDVKTPYRDG